MRIFNLIITSKRKLDRLVSDFYQKGLNRGYGLGEIAGRAEARNRGCILSGNIQEEADQILKESEDGK